MKVYRLALTLAAAVLSVWLVGGSISSAVAQGPNPPAGLRQGPKVGPTPEPKGQPLPRSVMVSPGDSKTPRLSTPPLFASVYDDRTDGAMSIFFADVNGLSGKKVTPNGVNGYNTAVAGTPGGGFAYLWNTDRCLGVCGSSSVVTEITYTLLDRNGNTLKGPTKLADLSGALLNTADRTAAIAVTPDGRIGILWLREQKNSANQYLDNVYFAVLDAAGNVVMAPNALTANTLLASDPYLWTPQIAATGDKRFVIAWGQAATPVGNIVYAVRDSNGASIVGPTALTTDGNNILHSANRTAGNTAIITWWCNWDLCYSVLSSSGAVVKGRTNLTNNGTQVRWSSDAAMLSNGATAIAWTDYDGAFQDLNQLAFALLDQSFNPVAGPFALDNGRFGNGSISMAPDMSGQAIITWTEDTSPKDLFYSIIDGYGYALLPRAFWSSTTSVDTSPTGYGTALYSSAVPSGVDAWISIPSTTTRSGGTVTIPVTRGNRGFTTAGAVTLSATLDPALVYQGNTLGINPAVSGNTLTWALPDMGFFDWQQFNIMLGVPSAAGGTHYTVTWTIASAGPEANPANNTVTSDIALLISTYLPIIRR